MVQNIIDLRRQCSLLIFVLIFLFCQINDICADDEFDGVNSREIQPPFRNSGVGDRQSAYRRILHEQLERLTHAELKNEQDSREYSSEHKEDEVHNHEDKSSVIQNQYHESEEKRTDYDEHEDHADVDHAEDKSSDERTYNPWRDSFQDIFDDGTYAYGYNLPNGVTRYERSFYSEKYKGRVVEGFFTQPRHYGNRILYELRCYRSDYYNGYRPLGVQYLKYQPIVERDTEPDVDCFHKH